MFVDTSEIYIFILLYYTLARHMFYSRSFNLLSYFFTHFHIQYNSLNIPSRYRIKK